MPTPVIFWASDPVRPNETVKVIGEYFDGATVRLRSVSSSTDRPWLVMTDAELHKQAISFVVPEGYAQENVYDLQIETPDGLAETRLNAPVIYWTQQDGLSLRVFGRNLGFANLDNPILRLEDTTGHVEDLIGVGDEWSASFPLLAPGVYIASYFNQRGDWMQLPDVTIVAAPPAIPDNLFPVVKSGSDPEYGSPLYDTNADFQAALDAASVGGGKVILSRGRYRVSAPLVVPEGVAIEGAGMDQTAIMFDDFDAIPIDTAPEELISGTRGFEVRDLTIFATNHRRVISAAIAATAEYEPGGVVVERVRVRANKYMGNENDPDEIAAKYEIDYRQFDSDAVRIGGANNRIVDCDLYSSNRTIFAAKCRDTVIARNKLQPGRVGWYNLSGSDRVIFEDNEIIGADLMSTGGGITMLGTDSRYSANVFFARNSFKRLHGWDREAMTTDGSGAMYEGFLAKVDDTHYQITGALNPDFAHRADNAEGSGLFILGGTGRCQHRMIVSIQNGVIELVQPFAAEPDATSFVSATRRSENYVIVGNSFEDVGSAVQFYGTSTNHVVADNVAARSSGFVALGRFYYGQQPSWFCQFLNNRIADGNTYHGGPNTATFMGEGSITLEGRQKNFTPETLNVSGVIRRNTLEGNARIQILAEHYEDAPGVSDAIVEGNSVSDADVGIYLKGNEERLIERNNSFQDVDETRYHDRPDFYR